MSEPRAETAEAPRGLDAWLEADYQRTVGNLRADLTRAQLAASVLLSALKAIENESVFNQQRFAEDDDADYFLRCFRAVKERAREAIASVESPTRKEEAR